MKKQPGSLRLGLLTTIVVCWLLPIVIVVAMAGILLEDSFRRSVQQEIDSGAESALSQVELYLTSVITDSKAVSYDGVVRSAYRNYCDDGNSVEMYRRINDYLSQTFSLADRCEAVFISFWDPDLSLTPYVITKGTSGHSIHRAYQDHMPALLDRMSQVDTGLFFQILDGKLYLTRNLLDSSFKPYATVISLLDTQALFYPLDTLSRSSDLKISLDDCRFRIGADGVLEPVGEDVPRGEMYYETQADGHNLAFSAMPEEYNIWEYTPWLRWALVLVMLLVFPTLAIVIGLFYRNLTRPMEVLADANRKIQAGQRGFRIAEQAPNLEFEKLYDHFNAMSEELENQFERSYLEQQATQQAKIKALQSQINPHFLNNTLEIINWEARIAEDERVCAMIEALSTMLDAALDRDGRSQIPLREELGYVDAYLYIIRQRLGEGLRIQKEIDEAVLEQLIPRLVLQPLVENAVEHDLTERHGGDLWIRAYQGDGIMTLEVEHDGTMTESDKENVRKLLSTAQTPARGAQVGLRNVNQRLGLLYGGLGSLTLAETGHGTILARIRLPV